MNIKNSAIKLISNLLVIILVITSTSCGDESNSRKNKNANNQKFESGKNPDGANENNGDIDNKAGSRRNTKTDSSRKQNNTTEDGGGQEEYDDDEDNEEEDDDDDYEDDDRKYGNENNDTDDEDESSTNGEGIEHKISISEESEISKMDKIFEKEFNSCKHITFPQKAFDLSSIYGRFYNYLNKTSNIDGQECPPVEKCIKIDGKPYYVTGKVNPNSNDLTYNL